MRSETKDQSPRWYAALGSGWQLVLDALFPESCLSCRREGDPLCLACRTKIVPALRQGCPICAASRGRGKVCFHCQSRTGLAGLTTLCEGEGALIRKLLRYYRTHAQRRFGGQSVVDWLVAVLQRGRVVLPTVYQQSSVVVVPEKRQLVGYRGSSRPIPLADLLKKADYNCLDILRWRKKLAPQRFLTRGERFANVGGQMQAIAQPADCRLSPNSPLLVFDDVFTTGATLNETAAALRAAGWQNIWGLVLYREW